MIFAQINLDTPLLFLNLSKWLGKIVDFFWGDFLGLSNMLDGAVGPRKYEKTN